MKTIYMICCALIALVAFSAPVAAEIVGDVNSDNRITAADSVLALQMSVGSIAPDIERADVSGDGKISSLDCVNTPEVVSGTFNATIDVYNVVDLDSGQFDLSFNSSVVNVTAVYDGGMAGTTVPIDAWNFTDADTVHVDLNSTGGASGSRLLATISFEVLGEVGDVSILDISAGQIVDTGANNTPALWFDSEVTVGVPVTVNSPDVASVVSGTFNDVENGLIDGTTMKIDEWKFMDSDTIRVISRRTGISNVVSGSGYLATINFTITGSQGNTSILDISDGKLAGILSEGTTDAEEIPATWTDDEVAVGVPVTANTSDVVSGTFNVMIDIENVLNLKAGQFDLSFDSSVVNVTDVENGLIDGTTMKIAEWKFMDSDTIRVISRRTGIGRTVSGSGYLATINFSVTGSGTSVLGISDGKLAGILTEGTTDAEEIPATWADDEVSV